MAGNTTKNLAKLSGDVKAGLLIVGSGDMNNNQNHERDDSKEKTKEYTQNANGTKSNDISNSHINNNQRKNDNDNKDKDENKLNLNENEDGNMDDNKMDNTNNDNDLLMQSDSNDNDNENDNDKDKDNHKDMDNDSDKGKDDNINQHIIVAERMVAGPPWPVPKGAPPANTPVYCNGSFNITDDICNQIRIHGFRFGTDCFVCYNDNYPTRSVEHHMIRIQPYSDSTLSSTKSNGANNSNNDNNDNTNDENDDNEDNDDTLRWIFRFDNENAAKGYENLVLSKVVTYGNITKIGKTNENVFVYSLEFLGNKQGCVDLVCRINHNNRDSCIAVHDQILRVFECLEFDICPVYYFEKCFYSKVMKRKFGRSYDDDDDSSYLLGINDFNSDDNINHFGPLKTFTKENDYITNLYDELREEIYLSVQCGRGYYKPLAYGSKQFNFLISQTINQYEELYDWFFGHTRNYGNFVSNYDSISNKMNLLYYNNGGMNNGSMNNGSMNNGSMNNGGNNGMFAFGFGLPYNDGNTMNMAGMGCMGGMGGMGGEPSRVSFENSNNNHNRNHNHNHNNKNEMMGEIRGNMNHNNMNSGNGNGNRNDNLNRNSSANSDANNNGNNTLNNNQEETKVNTNNNNNNDGIANNNNNNDNNNNDHNNNNYNYNNYNNNGMNRQYAMNPQYAMHMNPVNAMSFNLAVPRGFFIPYAIGDRFIGNGYGNGNSHCNNNDNNGNNGNKNINYSYNPIRGPTNAYGNNNNNNSNAQSRFDTRIP